MSSLVQSQAPSSMIKHVDLPIPTVKTRCAFCEEPLPDVAERLRISPLVNQETCRREAQVVACLLMDRKLIRKCDELDAGEFIQRDWGAILGAMQSDPWMDTAALLKRYLGINPSTRMLVEQFFRHDNPCPTHLMNFDWYLSQLLELQSIRREFTRAVGVVLTYI